MMQSITQKIIKDDVRKHHRDLYKITKKCNEIKILKVPSMKYIVSSGILRGNFYGVRSIEECNN